MSKSNSKQKNKKKQTDRQLVTSKHVTYDNNNFRFDRDVGAAYLYVDRSLKYDQTLPLVKGRGFSIMVDLDKQEKVIGYEFLFRIECPFDL